MESDGYVAGCHVVLREGVGGGDADSHACHHEGACDGVGGGAGVHVARELDACDDGVGAQTVAEAAVLPLAPPACCSLVPPRVADTGTIGLRCCHRHVAQSLVPLGQH